jgi:GNAT superfamily N-acetyltransferase
MNTTSNLKFKAYTCAEILDNMLDQQFLEDDDRRYQPLHEMQCHFKYFNFRYMSDNEIFLFMYEDEVPVGIVKIKHGGTYSCNFPDFNNWIGFISISRKHWGRGLARPLVKGIFEYCRENNIDKLLQSSYSDLGWNRLQKYFDDYAPQYPEIEFMDPKLRTYD